jgi:hypothetical protein
MFRDPAIHKMGSQTGEHKYVLVMELARPPKKHGRIYRADVTVRAEADDALAHAQAMVEGWQKIVEDVKLDKTSALYDEEIVVERKTR